MKYLQHLFLVAVCLGGPCDVRAQGHEVGHWIGMAVGGGPCTSDQGEPVLLTFCVGSDEVHTSGVACLQFVGGPSILLPNIRHAENIGGAIWLESAQAFIVDTAGEAVARVNKPLLIVAEDVEGEALLILDDETINLRFEPGFGNSIESLPAGRTNFLAGCADDRGSLLGLALAYGDEDRPRGFGFVTFEDPGSASPVEISDVQISGRGRNETRTLTGEAPVEIRGTIVFVPIVVVVKPRDGLGLVSIPAIEFEEHLILREDDILAVIEK